MAALLGGCGRDNSPDALLGARVNGAAISLAQIRGASEGSAANNEEARKAAAKRVLEQLVNQQLFVQQAEEHLLAGDPKVAQALEAARRQVLARAWIDKVSADAVKPSDAEVAKFYDDNPDLFARRRVYRLLQLTIPGDAALRARLEHEMAAIAARTEGGQRMQRMAAWLQSQGIQFRPTTATQGAEQVPLGLTPRLVQMKPGDWLLVAVEGGYHVLQVAAAEEQPLDRDKARPMIERFLGVRARQDALQGELKRLRADAKIEYFGEFSGVAGDGDGGAQAGLPTGDSAPPKEGAPTLAPDQGGSDKP